MKLVRACTLLIFFSCTSECICQHAPAPGVEVIGKATDRSIKIRWAPSTPALWRFANQYGYTVERITVSQGNKLVKPPVKKLLTPEEMKPLDETVWKKFVGTDDNILIAAQAIFGESFQVSAGANSDVLATIQKSKALELRFSFALFAADQSQKVAELSGLYLEDENVLPGEKYVYRVYANVPPALYPSDTGFVFIGLQDYKPLPKITDLAVSSGDRTSLVTWNNQLTSKIYNAFLLERSEDGITFRSITKSPIVTTSRGRSKKSDLEFKSDSLPANNVPYFYRVRGIDAFGEIGPASDTASTVGRFEFVHRASIENHSISKDGLVTLMWSFPPDGKSLLDHFELTREDAQGNFIANVRSPIADTCRSNVDANPLSSNYYVLTAVDHFGRKTKSFPYFVELEDSIAPKKPYGLHGMIDTTGLVYINWDNNAEHDLLGYAVFKANFATEEFIQLPGQLVNSPAYADTISLSNLTEKIYYKIKAIDRRYNYSEYSDVLILTKPDQVPPTQPAFVSVSYDSTGIKLLWEPSESADVEKHLLYRKGENDIQNEWTLIAAFAHLDSLGAYLDKDVRHREKYYYTIISIDDSGNESDPAVPVSFRWVSDQSFPPVTEIFFTVSDQERRINIKWSFNDPLASKFLVYRASNGNPMTLIKTVDASINELVDYYKTSDLRLEYRIAVGFSTGETSKLSKSIVIKI